MRVLAGQGAKVGAKLRAKLGARLGVRLAGFRLHWIGQVLLLVVLLPLTACAVLIWRLDQGPLDVPWLGHRIERFAAAHGVALHVGGTQIAWAGFSGGNGAPLRLILTDYGSTALHLHLARLEAGFSVGGLLQGDLVPGTLSITGARGELRREADGRIDFGVQHGGTSTPAPTPPTRAALSTAPQWWRQVHALHLHDVQVALADAASGLSGTLRGVDVDLTHDAQGLSGHAAATLESGGQTATMTAAATPGAGGRSVLRASLSALDPATVAALSPSLSAGSALDAAVTLRAEAKIGADLLPQALHVDATLGAGTLRLGSGSAPEAGGTLHADAGTSGVDGTVQLRTAARPDATPTLIAGTLHATRDAGGGGFTARIAMTVDQVAFADLPALWPAGTGGKGARKWILANITDGVAHDAKLDLTLAIKPDLSDLSVTAIDVGMDGDGLTVWWLRPVPPIMQGRARLTMHSVDAIDIAVPSALQGTGTGAGTGASGEASVAYRNGRVHITGILEKDQSADIATDLDGSVAGLLSVLKNPRMSLLSKRPVPLNQPSGTFTARLTLAALPLRDKLSMDDVRIATTARFFDLHLGGIAAGHSLDHGNLSLQADNDGLHAQGTAVLAGIAAKLRVGMDFRAGPPTQVEQDVSMSGTADERTLAGAGLDTGGLLHGPIAMQARLRTLRSGRSDVSAQADATAAALSVPQIGYDKPRGKPLHGTMALQIDHDRLTAINQVRIEGYDVSVSGSADIADGRPNLVRFDSLELGATRAHGEMRLPGRRGAPYTLTLSGPTLDASGPLGGTPKPAAKVGAKKSAAGPPYVVDAHFDRVLLGHGRVVLDAAAHASSDGTLIRSAALTGRADSVTAPAGSVAQPFRITLAPEPGGRRLVAQAPDAGGLLRVLGVADDILGGRMNVGAHYDDTKPDHPLSGTAELSGFRVLDAPAIGRVLQAVTLYGLVEMLRGPGLGFQRAVAPFRWTDGTLQLTGARAYSASLGLTAQGTVDLDDSRLDLTGTVVPFYAINTLPGRIPLIGRLFSPEKSGGLFAATYAVRGPMRDPNVVVNPFAAVTPGILRKLFNLF